MSEGGKSDDGAGSFATLLLRHACKAHCNPSSLRQRLVHGGDHHAAQEHALRDAKLHCIHGCELADRSLANTRRDTLLEEKGHEVVMDSAQIAMLRTKAIDILHHVRDRCAEDCVDECKNVARTAASFQGYDRRRCEEDCGSGCSRYVDQLKAPL
jgi:Fe-S cluster assembly iron-binding protein IscA